MNADETGLRMIPCAKRTIAPKGTRQIKGCAKFSQAQVTKVTLIAADGAVGGYQLIFAGKSRLEYFRAGNPQRGCHHAYSETHFANTTTTELFVKHVVLPFVRQQKTLLVEAGKMTENEARALPAVLIWDNFSPHRAQTVLDLLAAHNVHALNLPANCTSLYQPLDVNFNGPEKVALTKTFDEWINRRITQANFPVRDLVSILPRSAGQRRRDIAGLIATVHAQMKFKTMMVLNAWRAANFEFPDHSVAEVHPRQPQVVQELFIDEPRPQLEGSNMEEEEEDDDSDEDLDSPALAQARPDGEDVPEEDDAKWMDTSLATAYAQFDLNASAENGQSDSDSSFVDSPSMSRSSSSACSDFALPANCLSDNSVLISKGANRGEIHVKYQYGERPDAQELLALIARELPKSFKVPTTSDVYNITDSGYSFILEGPDRSTICTGATFFWSTFVGCPAL